MQKLLEWDMYELISDKHALNGVKLRGRLRKFGIRNHINIIADNTECVKGRVRFCVLTSTDITPIKEFLKNIISDLKLEKKFEKIKNPVLSKIKVNNTDRYEI